MKLFVYGMLRDPAMLARRGGQPGLGRRMEPALVAGYRRVRLHGGKWPTLRRAPGAVLPGAVLHVGADALRRFAAYEGPAYPLVALAARTATRKTRAYAWIAPSATREAWSDPRSLARPVTPGEKTHDSNTTRPAGHARRRGGYTRADPRSGCV